MRVVLPEDIGGYRLLEHLGAGGTGTVYRALDADGRIVALKALHPYLGADPEARERLRSEVANLRRVRHPGVARVLDAEIESSDAFVVTELVEGCDLATHVAAHGPLSAAELADLAEHLRAALVVVHEAGVLHRDVSPGNVMMTEAGPVLIDFGVAQAVEDVRVASAGMVTGTPGYLAPELLEGGQPSPAADWWGWAALLAFAASGRPPFGKGAVPLVLARARSGNVDLGGVDRRVAAVLRTALAVDPWRRCTPEVVTEELSRAALGAPPSPTREHTVDARWRTRLLPAAAEESWTPDGDSSDAVEEGSADGEETATPDGSGDAVDWLADAVPAPPRRTGTVAALALPLVALGLAQPGLALVIGLGLAILVRSIGRGAESVYRRRAWLGRRGGGDVVRGVVGWPWHVACSALAVVPAAVVAGVVVVVAGGLAQWLAGARAFVVAVPSTGEAVGVLPGNAGWVGQVMLAGLVAIGLLVVWFGPVARATRTGARWALSGLAPGMTGGAAVAMLAVGGAVAVGALMLGSDIGWWPLAGPPNLG